MKLLACLIIFIIISCSTVSNTPVFLPSVAQTEYVMTIEAPDENHTAVQGATFDGEYFYTAFIDRSQPKESAIIVKTDKAGVEVAKSEILPLDHANSITVMKNGNLMIAHCHSIDENYNRFSILDKDSLEIIVTADLAEPCMAIAYCEAKDQYVSGEWNGEKVNIYDYDLIYTDSFEVDFLPNSTPQSYYCNDDAIYHLRFTHDGGFENYLYSYSHDGKKLLEYKLDLPSDYEAEALSVIENEVYVMCAANQRCEIFKIEHLVI